ncbi:serine hydrolase domain-containing protein [Hymenobacter elongatus]|uniref:Class A beta-lactamase-related serine hydrolase n=1 Tax=Hymenobacter elongatus TaxID=877208 RepID=A0A4Z0PH67_9BACT|nr:serine hydrolase domain-containing protein [Hymenobacter elongatus]TGE14140.1 class A beta-lactamase-related serine hydrolase [Hymenobacter elongatus]
MKQAFLSILLFFSQLGLAQSKLERIMNDEFSAGYFNGAALVIRSGQVVLRVNKGEANKQFAVPITDKTRFPIASMTKTFTAILTLQLLDKAVLRLDDKAARYLPELPADCQNITLHDLLTHRSGLKNEPAQAYAARYPPAEYVQKYVARNPAAPAATFNYNNIDYVLLTRVLEVATRKSYHELLAENILRPLRMTDTGVIHEARITPNLAYGYHNYSFGAGTAQDTLTNDLLPYLSNYAGAGALYSTPDDLYKLVQGLKDNRLLSKKGMQLLTGRPEKAAFIGYARGYPGLGFYYNDRTFAQPVLERRGSINGFNSVLLTDRTFDHLVILLTNTDTADLEKLADQLYTESR